MPGSKPIIGLVGGIGSGKSSVAAALEREGALIIDADAMARAALDRPEVLAKLVEWWGPDVIDSHGRADRRQIAARVFDDDVERRRLEAVVHPIVAAGRDQMIAEARANPNVRAIVLDVPLLLEVGMADLCDRIVFVRAPRELRLKRLAASRGWDEAELARREKKQWPLDRKLQFAHDILDNDVGEVDRDAQVRHLLRRIIESTTPA